MNKKIRELFYVTQKLYEAEGYFVRGNQEAGRASIRVVIDYLRQKINEEKRKELRGKNFKWVKIQCTDDSTMEVPAKVLEIEGLKTFLTIHDNGIYQVYEYYTGGKIAWGWSKESAIQEAKEFIKEYFKNKSKDEIRKEYERLGIINQD
ncbi:MAG: hypothetical protein NC921_03950 [Candidatus Omnitrophica bacterium]|nr:hypothetical protein [Candidatus Omnitrophota bacterium]